MPGKITASSLVLAIACTGCIGYSRPAKRWSYVGNTVLVAGGGTMITLDVISASGSECMANGPRPCPYEPPVGGQLVAGAVLVAAGVIGYVLTATRPTARSSR